MTHYDVELPVYRGRCGHRHATLDQAEACWHELKKAGKNPGLIVGLVTGRGVVMYTVRPMTRWERLRARLKEGSR